jgi:hypothetical protein
VNGTDDRQAWRVRHEELVRDARHRRLARALRVEDRARRAERRLRDLAPGGGSGVLAEDGLRRGGGRPRADNPEESRQYGPWDLWGRTLVPFFDARSRS